MGWVCCLGLFWFEVGFVFVGVVASGPVIFSFGVLYLKLYFLSCCVGFP